MTLTYLPNELIEHIASYLDLPSTCSLRLTTSSLTEASSHLFRDRFFQQHTVTWTKQSLDILVQISQHAHYGTALSHLIIDATPQHSMRFWQLRKRVSETAAISTPYGVVASPEQRELQAQYALAEKKVEETTTFFNETRYDQKMLKNAFQTLSNSGCSLTSITFLYTGLSCAYVKGSPLYCHLSQCEMSRPFVSTMAALASSPQPRLTRISLSRDAPHGAISIGRLESLAPHLSALSAAFTSLRHLALNLRDWRHPDTGFEPPTSRLPFIVRFLARAASNLTSLELSCYSALEPQLFADIAQHCCFANLQSCSLSVMNVGSASDLSAFLAPSLTTLRLRHVLLRDRETSWQDWLAWLASTATTASPPAPAAHGETVYEATSTTITAKERTTTTTCLTHLCVADLFQSHPQVVHFRGKRALCLDGADWASRLRDVLHEEGGIEAREWRPQWTMGAFAYPFVGLSM